MSFFLAGVVELVADFTVCKEGEPISPEGSRILVNLPVNLDILFVNLNN